MSFILDALKKSENDRQRQSGPAFFEVRVAPPRSRFPAWAIALVALLVVNLAVIGWLMFRRPATAATPPIQAAASPPVTAVPVQPAPAAPPPVAQMPAPSGPVAASGYPQQQPLQGPTQEQDPAPTLGQDQPGYSGGPEPPQQALPGDTRFAATDGNADDYAPATEPSEEAPIGRVRRGFDNGLMTYQEAATKNTIPPLHMDLHVYAQDPRRRFVLVNGKRLSESQSLPEGVKVDSITTDGAILSYRGVQFMMERD